MQADEPRHGFDVFHRESQPVERTSRHLSADDVVAHKGAARPGRDRLAHVVEHGGQAHDEIGGCGSDHKEGVPEHVVRVIAALLDPLASGQLGEDHLQQ